eukprot:sb/3460461/
MTRFLLLVLNFLTLGSTAVWREATCSDDPTIDPVPWDLAVVPLHFSTDGSSHYMNTYFLKSDATVLGSININNTGNNYYLAFCTDELPGSSEPDAALTRDAYNDTPSSASGLDGNWTMTMSDVGIVVEFEGEILIDHKYNKSADKAVNCEEQWYGKIAFVDFCGGGAANYYLAGCDPIVNAVNTVETTLLEEETVICNDGYGRIGPSVMTCLVNGTWNETTPTQCHQLSYSWTCSSTPSDAVAWQSQFGLDCDLELNGVSCDGCTGDICAYCPDEFIFEACLTSDCSIKVPLSPTKESSLNVHLPVGDPDNGFSITIAATMQISDTVYTSTSFDVTSRQYSGAQPSLSSIKTLMDNGDTFEGLQTLLAFVSSVSDLNGLEESIVDILDSVSLSNSHSSIQILSILDELSMNSAADIVHDRVLHLINSAYDACTSNSPAHYFGCKSLMADTLWNMWNHSIITCARNCEGGLVFPFTDVEFVTSVRPSFVDDFGWRVECDDLGNVTSNLTSYPDKVNLRFDPITLENTTCDVHLVFNISGHLFLDSTELNIITTPIYTMPCSSTPSAASAWTEQFQISCNLQVNGEDCIGCTGDTCTLCPTSIEYKVCLNSDCSISVPLNETAGTNSPLTVDLPSGPLENDFNITIEVSAEVSGVIVSSTSFEVTDVHLPVGDPDNGFSITIAATMQISDTVYTSTSFDVTSRQYSGAQPSLSSIKTLMDNGDTFEGLQTLLAFVSSVSDLNGLEESIVDILDSVSLSNSHSSIQILSILDELSMNSAADIVHDRVLHLINSAYDACTSNSPAHYFGCKSLMADTLWNMWNHSIITCARNCEGGLVFPFTDVEFVTSVRPSFVDDFGWRVECDDLGNVTSNLTSYPDKVNLRFDPITLENTTCDVHLVFNISGHLFLDSTELNIITTPIYTMPCSSTPSAASAWTEQFQISCNLQVNGEDCIGCTGDTCTLCPTSIEYKVCLNSDCSISVPLNETAGTNSPLTVDLPSGALENDFNITIEVSAEVSGVIVSSTSFEVTAYPHSGEQPPLQSVEDLIAGGDTFEGLQRLHTFVTSLSFMNSTTIEDVLAIIENIPLSQSRSSVEILAILHSLTSQTAVVKVSSRVSDLATEAYAASGENSQHYAEECALLTWAVMENLLKIAIPEGSASGVEETAPISADQEYYNKYVDFDFAAEMEEAETEMASENLCDSIRQLEISAVEAQKPNAAVGQVSNMSSSVISFSLTLKHKDEVGDEPMTKLGDGSVFIPSITFDSVGIFDEPVMYSYFRLDDNPCQGMENADRITSSIVGVNVTYVESDTASEGGTRKRSLELADNSVVRADNDKIDGAIEVLINPSFPILLNTFTLDPNKTNQYFKVKIASGSDMVMVIQIQAEGDVEVWMKYKSFPTSEDLLGVFPDSDLRDEKNDKLEELEFSYWDFGSTDSVLVPSKGEGTYYFKVLSNDTDTFSLKVLTTACLEWTTSGWSLDTGNVGILTNSTATHCSYPGPGYFAADIRWWAVKEYIEPIIPVYIVNKNDAYLWSPVVMILVMFVSIYLLVRRLDERDKVSRSTLYRLTENETDYSYTVDVCTGLRVGGSTTAAIRIELVGGKGKAALDINQCGIELFGINQTSTFLYHSDKDIGELEYIKVSTDCSGSSPNWYLKEVRVRDHRYHRFPFNGWLGVQAETFSSTIYPSTEHSPRRLLQFVTSAITEYHCFLSGVLKTRTLPSRTFLLTMAMTRILFVLCFSLVSQDWLILSLLGISPLPLLLLLEWVVQQLAYNRSHNHHIEAYSPKEQPMWPRKFHNSCLEIMLTNLPVVSMVVLLAVYPGLAYTSRDVDGQAVLIRFVVLLAGLLFIEQPIISWIRCYLIRGTDFLDHTQNFEKKVEDHHLANSASQPTSLLDEMLQSIEKWSGMVRKERKNQQVFIRLIMYVLFIGIVVAFAKQDRNVNCYYLNTSLKSLFTKSAKYESIETVDEYWKYLQNNFTETLSDDAFYENTGTIAPSENYLSDGTNIIISIARLRQVRIEHQNCTTTNVTEPFVSCWPPYRDGLENKANYSTSWEDHVPLPANARFPTIRYRSYWAWEEGQHSFRTHGTLTSYPVSGYTVPLANTPRNAKAQMEYLQKDGWIDRNTRAVLVELTVYNPSTGLMCSVKLLAEFLPTGNIVTSSYFHSVNFFLYSQPMSIGKTKVEISYLIFLTMLTVYNMYQFISARTKGTKVWRGFWSLLDLGIMVIGWTAVVLYLIRQEVLQAAIAEFNETPIIICLKVRRRLKLQEKRDCLGGLMFLFTVKIIDLFLVNMRIRVLTIITRRSLVSLASLGVPFFVLFATKWVCKADDKPRLEAWKSLWGLSLGSTFGFVLGEVNWAEMRDTHPVLAPIFGFLLGISSVVYFVNLFAVIVCHEMAEVSSGPATDKESFPIFTYMGKLLGDFLTFVCPGAGEIARWWGVHWKKHQKEKYAVGEEGDTTRNPYLVESERRVKEQEENIEKLNKMIDVVDERVTKLVNLILERRQIKQ